MARKARKKAVEVQKWGGTEDLGATKMHGYDHDVSTVEVQSTSNLQMDKGEGGYVIIRKFTYGMNPVAFKEAKPTKQDLFNYHLKQIEIALWQDGWKLFTDVQPQLKFDLKKGQYSIFVGAIPQSKFNTINAEAKTLSQIANS